MPYDIAAMRERLKASMSGRPQDPNEFRPPKANAGEIIKFRFFVMPPLQKGDICVGGKMSRAMEMFYVPYGHHWVDQRPHPCPRILSEGDADCAMCQNGFDILKEMKTHKCTREELRATARQWLPQVANLVNIYFPAVKTNPEELHNQVKYFKSPQACFGHWRDCLDRDDAGDPEEPEAFGAFFDEIRAYLYQLQIGKAGEWNEYKTSKFIAVDLKGNNAAMPIALSAKGAPDMKRINEILALRHDLWLKQGTADPIHMEKLVAKLLDGDDAAEEAEGNFDHDESKKPARSSRPARSTAATTPTAAAPARAAAPVLDEEDEDVAVPVIEEPDEVIEVEVEVKPPPKATRPVAAKPEPVAQVETPARKPKAAKPKPEPEDEVVEEIITEVDDGESVLVGAAVVPEEDDSTIAGMLDQLEVED